MLKLSKNYMENILKNLGEDNMSMNDFSFQKQIKTISCLIDGILLKVYKIDFCDKQMIYLITRLSLRDPKRVLKTMKLKHLIGNVFRISKFN